MNSHGFSLFLLVMSMGTQVLASDALLTASATMVELPRVYRLDGVVESAQRATVSAQTSGQVIEVAFDVDALVHAGDVIVVLNDTEQQAAVSQAEASLQSAQAQLVDVDKEYRRIAEVFEKQAVSKSSLDKALAVRKTAQAQVQSAQAALETARQQLTYTRIRAPYTGVVTERLIEIGEIAHAGQRVMSGISLEQLRVNVDVPQNLIVAIRTQPDAEVLIDSDWVKARQVTIFPVADQGTDSFRVRLELPLDISGVFPGMYVKTAFVTGKQRSLMVPVTAVVNRSEVTGVYVVDDMERISFRHIRVGAPIGHEHISILSGLDPQERVALDPIAATGRLKEQRKEARRHE